jgi:hypothetical protein
MNSKEPKRWLTSDEYSSNPCPYEPAPNTKGNMSDKTQIRLNKICKKLAVLDFKLHEFIEIVNAELRRLKKKK